MIKPPRKELIEIIDQLNKKLDARDITKRLSAEQAGKQTEEALKEAQRYTRGLIEINSGKELNKTGSEIASEAELYIEIPEISGIGQYREELSKISDFISSYEFDEAAKLVGQLSNLKDSNSI